MRPVALVVAGLAVAVTAAPRHWENATSASKVSLLAHLESLQLTVSANGSNTPHFLLQQ